MTPIGIAHRGLWWPHKSYENSLAAIELALQAGFGIEIDVRRGPTDLVLSHNPLSGDSLSLTKFNDALLAAKKFAGAPILIDIKEPGTEEEIALLLFTHDLVHRAYLFDFGLCGADPHAALSKFPETQCLIRVSDRPDAEQEKDFPAPWARGVWLDQFDTDWVTEVDIAKWLKGGPVFVVAPDLHNRIFDFKYLKQWKTATGICTDIPQLVQPVITGKVELLPYKAWWK